MKGVKLGYKKPALKSVWTLKGTLAKLIVYVCDELKGDDCP